MFHNIINSILTIFYYKDCNTLVRKYKLLIGLIYIKEIFAPYKLSFRLLGIEIFSLQYFGYKYLLKCIFFKIKFGYADKLKAKDLLLKTKSIYKLEFDDIYALFCPTGELYITLNLLQELIKKNKSQKPLIVCRKNFERNICKIFCPEIPCIVLPNSIGSIYKKSSFVIGKHKIFYYFVTEHYLKQDKLINSCGEHYYSYIIKDLGLSEDQINFKYPYITKETEKEIQNYQKVINLNNFVMIFPEAVTCSKLPKKFWIVLCDKLSQKGYDIFTNITDMRNYIPHTKAFCLNHQETLALAQKAKAIIGLRCGMLELLTQYDVPMYCIYNHLPPRPTLLPMSAENVLSGFTLKKLPNVNVNNIFEYNAENYSEDELINLILKKV